MVVVLKDADFSANNIGKVNVEEINDFTLAAISASGNDSMTSNQISALNSFFATIGAWDNDQNSIFSRMMVIYLPILSKDVAHSMVNYVDNTIPKNSSNTPVTPSGGATIRTHGLVSTDATTDTYGAKFTGAWNGEFSLLWLRNEKFTSSSPTTNNGIAFIRAQTGNNQFINVYETNVPANSRSVLSTAGLTVPSSDFMATNYDAEVIGAAGITLRSEGDAYSIYNGLGVARNWSLSNTWTPTSETWFETRCFGATKVNNAASLGVVMFGHSLTNAEMQSVAEAINGLRDAFLTA